MKRIIVYALLLAAASFGSQTDWVKSNPMIISDDLRISVLNECCLRVEVGKFNDLGTYMVPERDLSFSDFSFTNNASANEISIKTKYCEFVCSLRHLKAGEKLDSKDWKIRNCTIYAWNTNTSNNATFAGPLSTIDFKGGPVKLPGSLLSYAGFTVIEDTTPFIDGDSVIPRQNGPNDCDYYYISYGRDLYKGLDAFFKVSGRPPLPPRFAFGSSYSRWSPYTSTDYREIVGEYEKNELPLDLILWDVDWHRKDAKTGNKWAGAIDWTGWSINRELLPDAEKLISELKEKNIHVVPIVHPHDGIRSNEDCYADFMLAMGESSDGDKTLELDLANAKYVSNYFKYAHGELERAGVDYWWLDWQQDKFYPYVKGVPGLKHIPWLSRIYCDHSRKDNLRGLTFNRWGGFGSQRYPIYLSGDAFSSWSMLRFMVPYTALAANAGCFYLAHDLGGFYGGTGNPELQARWLQFGALTMAMRLHSDQKMEHRIWTYPEPFRSAMKNSFRLRAELMPYIYTCAYQAHKYSRPMIRPMYYGWPDESEAYKNPGQFMLGDCFLVAPLVQRGLGEDLISFQTMWFPEEGWYNYFTGETFGKGDRLLAGDLYEFPLFLKGGVPIPLGRMGKTLAELPQVMDIMLFPLEKDGEGEFSLYEDDGISEDYLNNICAITKFSYKLSGKIHEISICDPVGEFKGLPEKRSFEIVLRNIKSVAHVAFNGNEQDYDFDPELHVCTVKLPEGEVGKVVFEAELINSESVRMENALRRSKDLFDENYWKAFGIGLVEKDESPYYLKSEFTHKFFPGGFCCGFLFENNVAKAEVTLNNPWDAVKLPYPEEGTTNVISGIKAQLPSDVKKEVSEEKFVLKKAKRVH